MDRGFIRHVPCLGDVQLEDAVMNTPVVLVPGLDGTGLLFYKQVPLLARHHPVSTTRLRDDAQHMEELVADLHSEVERAAPDGGPVIVIGESFGGALSMSYALAHPDRVSRMVILNSFPRFDAQVRLRLGYAALRATPWGVMRVVRGLTARRMHSRETGPDEIREFHKLMRATTRQGYLSRLRLLRHYDIRDRLKAIRAPVLFLAADEDHLVPSVEQARIMNELTPGSSLRVLRGHGHICLIAPTLDLSVVLHEWITGS
jgi:pimeloyl-ACP methyl ester carboxylesterase